MLYTTFPDKESARNLSSFAIENKLVACANISGMDSLYFWKGETVTEGEVKCIMKTRISLKEEVTRFIEERHTYEVPCIVSWEVSANASYENWINKSTKEPGNE